LDFVGPAQLADSLEPCQEGVEALEGDRTYLNLSPKGEPQLGKRGLYGQIGGRSDAEERQMAMLWGLNLSDGGLSLLEGAGGGAPPPPPAPRGPAACRSPSCGRCAAASPPAGRGRRSSAPAAARPAGRGRSRSPGPATASPGGRRARRSAGPRRGWWPGRGGRGPR